MYYDIIFAFEYVHFISDYILIYGVITLNYNNKFA